MEKHLAGALAGFAATAPMTAAMVAMHRALPETEQDTLPPHLVTERLAEAAGLEDAVSGPENAALSLAATVAAHFGFGAAGGAVYAAVEHRLPGPPVARGVLFAMGVWSGSYMGWIPATGLMPPATEQRASRNGLMIAAHVVWGGALGWAVAALRDRE